MAITDLGRGAILVLVRGTMVVVALLVRIFGMFADGTVSENMRLVGAELGLLALTFAGLVIELRRRRTESTDV